VERIEKKKILYKKILEMLFWSTKEEAYKTVEKFLLKV
jgi:hypothetical protein